MKKNSKEILVYISVIFAVLIILNVIITFFGKMPDGKKVEIFNNSSGNFGPVSILLPAVDESGNGTITTLRVDIVNGSGKTLVGIDNLLFFADTQQSIRVARLVAQDVTKVNLSNYDLTYGIEANASVIGGPSAGAALAIATIAAIEGKKVRGDVLITGAINRDGSIGPVTSILTKAEASKRAGASVFLVPLLQSRDVIYETDEYCEKFGATEFCTEETKPRRVNITQETGIKIVEVENISEAARYFFS